MVLTILRNGGTSVALTLLAALLLQKKYRVPVWHIALLCVFSFAMAAVYTVTGLTPMSGGLRVAIHIADVNFVPFLSIYGIVQTSVENAEPMFAITNILGNVALFMPLGFLLPLLWKRYRKLWKVLLFGLAVTVGIEVIQLFLSRGTDLDDVLLNMFGTLAGYGLFRIFRRRARRLTVKCTLPKAQRRTLWRFFPYVCVLLPLLTSFLFGFIDRNAYNEAVPPASTEALASDAAGTAPENPAETDDNADKPANAQGGDASNPEPEGSNAPAVSDNIGMIVLNDPSSMTITSYRANPAKTATPTEEDLPMLTGLFFGRTLSSAIPACDSDIVIEMSDCKLTLDTSCGAVIFTTTELTGSATLSDEDVAVLMDVLAHYSLPTNRESAQ